MDLTTDIYSWCSSVPVFDPESLPVWWWSAEAWELVCLDRHFPAGLLRHFVWLHVELLPHLKPDCRSMCTLKNEMRFVYFRSSNPGPIITSVIRCTMVISNQWYIRAQTWEVLHQAYGCDKTWGYHKWAPVSRVASTGNFAGGRRTSNTNPNHRPLVATFYQFKHL